MVFLAWALLWPPLASSEEPTLLVFGDSLSAGYGIPREDAWPRLLQERLAEEGYDYRVVNTSRSGETTAGGVRRLPETLDEHEPEVAVLQLGGNDGLRGLPVEQMRRNLGRMIETALDGGSRVLLVGIRIPPNYGQAYVERFEAVYPELAQEYDIPLVPFLLEGVWDRAEMMQDDRIHPTSAAQPRMLDLVWEELEPLL